MSSESLLLRRRVAAQRLCRHQSLAFEACGPLADSAWVLCFEGFQRCSRDFNFAGNLSGFDFAGDRAEAHQEDPSWGV